jgi:hypothetical protein
VIDLEDISQILALEVDSCIPLHLVSGKIDV